jgi:hypothetical protein
LGPSRRISQALNGSDDGAPVALVCCEISCHVYLTLHVEGHDIPSLRDEPSADGRADRARRAGDEHDPAHMSIPPFTEKIAPVM